MGLRGFMFSFQASRPSEILTGCGLYLEPAIINVRALLVYSESRRGARPKMTRRQDALITR
jgi:hypothetical protein